MRSYIRKLQSKPVEVRKQMLVVSLVVSMAVVGAVWVYGLTYRFNDKNEDVATVEDSQTASPFKLFKNSIGSAYNNISASVSNISKNQDETEVELQSESKQIQMIPVDRNYTQ